MPYGAAPTHVVRTAASFTAINSATYLMNGLGAAATPLVITPQSTGRVLVVITGDLVENATAQTATLQLSYGTGAAPANAAALTGTQVGGELVWVSLTGQLTQTFALTWVITGLAVPSVNSVGATGAATAVWIDINSKSSAGTIQLTNVNASAIEL